MKNNAILYPEHGYIEIELTQGKFCLIDFADYDIVRNYKWYAIRCGKRYYAMTCTKTSQGKRKHFQMQRLLMNFPENMVVDHVSHDGLDNRKSNLRVCSHKNNIRSQPKRATNKSGYKGVYWNKALKKWHAQIFYGKKRHLGYYGKAEDAAKAYDKAAGEFQKEFAITNF